MKTNLIQILLLLPFFALAQKENLGPNINSAQEEVLPILSPDGKTLFFTRFSGSNNNDSEIYQSELDANGQWKKCVRLGRQLNNSNHNSVCGLTADNNQMLLLGDYSGGSSKFSISVRTDTGWSMPKPVFFEAPLKNLGSYLIACISSDGQVMIINVQERETVGGMDLYVSFRKPDGTWTFPKNMGRVLNTEQDELTPCIAPDLKTLYFSSKREGSLGSADVYVTRRLDDSWLQWTKPENLGNSVNTKDWDTYYFVPANGEYAFFTTENPQSQTDIFRIKLPENMKPNPTVLITGKVINKKTNKPMTASITYEPLGKKGNPITLKSDPKTGTYKIILPQGEVYGFYASRDGFYPVSENIDLKSLEKYTEIEKDLYLAPLESGETIRLNNLFFDFSKAEIREQSLPELDRLVKALEQNPAMKIEVSGHTDNVGAENSNQKLSEKRAESVKKYLTSQKIAPERIRVKGYGEAKPLANNSTEEGRQQNRRVEIEILNL